VGPVLDPAIIEQSSKPVPAARLLAGARDPVARRNRTVANIKSQMKRNRQNEKRRLRNRAIRSELRTREKAVMEAAGTDDETELLRLTIKRIDKAAAKGVLHKNAAARRKSRLVARVRQLSDAAS
jgi:small subunit ribosomal protein S20